MAKRFTLKVLARTRSSRKSSRTAEESPLMELELDIVGFLRGEWRIGCVRLVVENWEMIVGGQHVQSLLRLFVYCNTLPLMKANFEGRGKFIIG